MGVVTYDGMGWCTSPITRIDVTVKLFRDDVRTGGIGFDSRRTTVSVSAQAADRCVPGTYHGVVDATFIIPPGYGKASMNLVGRSNLAFTPATDQRQGVSCAGPVGVLAPGPVGVDNGHFGRSETLVGWRTNAGCEFKMCAAGLPRTARCGRAGPTSTFRP